jgi:hypothetical protein
MTRVFKPQAATWGFLLFGKSRAVGNTLHDGLRDLDGKFLPLKIVYRRRSPLSTMRSMGDFARCSSSVTLILQTPSKKKNHKVLLASIDLGASPQTPGIF